LLAGYYNRSGVKNWGFFYSLGGKGGRWGRGGGEGKVKLRGFFYLLGGKGGRWGEGGEGERGRGRWRTVGKEQEM